MLERWFRRDKVHAVHVDHLYTVINELGLLDKITAGEIFCSECGKPVTLDNIQCIYKQNDEIQICCDNINCCKSILKMGPSEE